MAEGWRQLVEDLSSALGFWNGKRPSPPITADDQSAGSAILNSSGEPDGSREPDSASEEESEQLLPVEITSPEETLPSGDEAVELEVNPPSTGQKMPSFAGLAIALALAVGFGWYVYFGGPKPPAPDVVATLMVNQVQQMREHLAAAAPGDNVVITRLMKLTARWSTPLLNKMVRRGRRTENGCQPRFKDAMPLRSVTLLVGCQASPGGCSAVSGEIELL
jgi:hypothetical protein